MENPLRVLVVDDETAVRESLTSFLEDYNYEVVSAGSAEEALNLLKNESIDAAIIDIRLPGIDGDTLIIRSHKIRPEIFFLIYTGSVEYQLSAELIKIGMRNEHVFLKPLADLSVFEKEINRHCL